MTDVPTREDAHSLASESVKAGGAGATDWDAVLAAELCERAPRPGVPWVVIGVEWVVRVPSKAGPRQRYSSVATRHQTFAAVAAATAALGPDRQPGSAQSAASAPPHHPVCPTLRFCNVSAALHLPTWRSRGCAAARRSCWSAGWIRWCGPRADR